MSRTLVIGDVHGNARALKQVLERANVTPEDTVIQLGDVADGWSETPECVDILLGLPNLISIRGNHDVWTYDWFNMGTKHHIWTSQGGQATIDAYVRTGKVRDRNHTMFWNEQKDWHIDEKNRLFIHAGWNYHLTGDFTFKAGYPVRSYGQNILGSISKECHWDRDLLMGAKSASVGKGGRFKALEEFNEIYIGHTASRDALPHKFLNLWQMDTGAGWHGKLTIMDIDTKEYWQSDFATVLYPEEKGRG